MSTINDLLKGRAVYHIDAGQTVLEAVRWMVDRNIGAVPVLREGELVGVFSERDLMKRMVAEGRDATRTRVSDVMTASPWVVPATETLENCLVLMRDKGFRHLPVVDGKRLVGFLSLRDILLHDVQELDDQVRMMRAYIHAGS